MPPIQQRSFIYPSASSDDRDKWENAGEQEEDEIKVSEVYQQWKDTKTSPPVATREGELDEGLGEVSTSRFKAICSDGDWPLNLVGLKDFSDFSQWEEVHHFAHHVLVVVVVAAEVTPQTVKVFLTTSFGVT